MTTARDEVSAYIREALTRGADRATIAADLTAAGWSKRDVARGLSAWGDASSGVPVPRPRPYVSAREAFVFGLMFVALVVSCVSLANVLFEVIERLVGDPFDQGYGGWNYFLRWNLATLVIFFPTFAILAWRFDQRRKAQPGARVSAVRKWLGYLGLFGASVTILCTGVSVIFSLLDGSITLQFLLKAATVALIALCVFGFFRQDTLEDRDE